MKDQARSNEFTVPYLGLSNGSHIFQFQLNNQFFGRFEKSSISKADLSVTVDFDKRERMVVLTVKAQGSFEAECDRCLANIQVPLEMEDQVYLKISDEVKPQEDEVFYLDSKTSHIDLSPFLYESIHLHLPIMNVRDCEREDFKYCDKDVLDSLETKELPETKGEDNPWSELDKLKFK